MEGIFHKYNGKLYDKDALLKWDLPERIKEQIGFNEFDYFFISSSIEKSKAYQHGRHHVHLTIYPIKNDIVNLLQVETPKIFPQLLHDILKILKNSNLDIVTSTGFCSHQDTCYFGIIFSASSDNNLFKIIDEIKKIKDVRNTKIFKFTCEGCDEI